MSVITLSPEVDHLDRDRLRVAALDAIVAVNLFVGELALALQPDDPRRGAMAERSGRARPAVYFVAGGINRDLDDQNENLELAPVVVMSDTIDATDAAGSLPRGAHRHGQPRDGRARARSTASSAVRHSPTASTTRCCASRPGKQIRRSIMNGAGRPTFMADTVPSTAQALR